jgi:type I restriction enzyme M protein
MDGFLLSAHRYIATRYDLDKTQKQRRMTRADLNEFVECYNPANHNQRKPTWDEQENPERRWRVFTYDELVARDKCRLDIFWLKDHSLEDSANLPDPDVLAAEIAEDLRSALEQIESVLADLRQRRPQSVSRQNRMSLADMTMARV